MTMMFTGSAMIGSALIGAYGSYSASRRASEAAGAANNLGWANYNLNLDQFNWQKDRAERFDRQKNAAEAPLWDIINTPGVKGWGEISSPIVQNFSNAQRATDENLARQGLTGSGLSGAAGQANKLELAKTLSSAWQRGIMSKADVASRLAGLQPTFNPSTAGVNDSARSLMGTLGQQAAGWNSAAAGFGKLAGAGIYGYMNRPVQAAEPAPAPQGDMAPGIFQDYQGPTNAFMENPLQQPVAPPDYAGWGSSTGNNLVFG